MSPLDSTRADLWLHGMSEGTDDVPSSTGQCIQALASRPHVRMLYGHDARGNWDLWHPDAHGTLEPATLAEGLTTGAHGWDHGDLRVAWMGYGSAFDGNGWQGTHDGAVRLLLRVTTDAGVQLAMVQVSTTDTEGFSELEVLGVVPEGEPLTW